MNGPEHYHAAEALLKSCQIDREGVIEYYPAREDGVDSTANAIAAAQVHATLALAAAQGLAVGWDSPIKHCGKHTGNASNRCLLAEGHNGACDDDPEVAR